ncbi:MAG TPA: hypothetical protein VN457_00185, partial [Chlamydiales bacterium]|nr:hypothetical protein [Chlamydiales bacterium]
SDLWRPTRIKDPETLFWLLLQNSPEALLNDVKKTNKSHSSKEILTSFLNKNEYVQEILTRKKQLPEELIEKVKTLIKKAGETPENNSTILPKLYFLLPHTEALGKELMSCVPQLFINDKYARMQFYTDFGNWGTQDFHPKSDVIE